MEEIVPQLPPNFWGLDEFHMFCATVFFKHLMSSWTLDIYFLSPNERVDGLWGANAVFKWVSNYFGRMLTFQANTSATYCLYILSTPVSLTASLWWLMRKLLGFLSFPLPRHQASVPEGWIEMHWKQSCRSTSCSQYSKQGTRGKAAREARNQTSGLPVQFGLQSSPCHCCQHLHQALSSPYPEPLESQRINKCICNSSTGWDIRQFFIIPVEELPLNQKENKLLPRRTGLHKIIVASTSESQQMDVAGKHVGSAFPV